MKCERCLRRETNTTLNDGRSLFEHRRKKKSLCGASLLFNGQRVRPGDRQFVEEHQELAEGLKEGPAGQQADALVGVDLAVGNHLLLHRGKHAQLDFLLLVELIYGVRLVELDGRPIHLPHKAHIEIFPFSDGPSGLRRHVVHHLLPAGDGQDERGENGEGVSSVGGPAFDLGAHWQTKERHLIGQGEGLVVVLRVAENEA